MYNQTEAVLSQYELEIRQINKGRGYQVCDTDKGKKLLYPFRGSKERGEWLRQYLKALLESGFDAEQILTNKNEETVTVDEVTGEGFIVKDYIPGTELSTSRYGEMLEVVVLLADYHSASESLGAWGCEYKGLTAIDVVENRSRHYREMVKVGNFIRSRKRKMDFERLYMAHYGDFLKTAEKSIGILMQQSQKMPQNIICHGECNQHNMIWSDGRWRLIHFENASYTWPEWDLANFIRKMLEKNDWDEELGMELVKTYSDNRRMGEDEYLRLYGLLLFPEKFWKIANHYINSNKAWVPMRDIEKLEKVIAQEDKRLDFVDKLFQEKLFSIEQE